MPSRQATCRQCVIFVPDLTMACCAKAALASWRRVGTWHVPNRFLLECCALVDHELCTVHAPAQFGHGYVSFAMLQLYLWTVTMQMTLLLMLNDSTTSLHMAADSWVMDSRADVL